MILETDSGAIYVVEPSGVHEDGKRYAFYRTGKCIAGYLIGCLPASKTTSEEKANPGLLLKRLFDGKLQTEERLPVVGDMLAINPQWWPEKDKGRHFYQITISTPVIDVLY